MAHTQYLSSKPRYEILDGLRGIAAVLVVFFHMLETYSAGTAYACMKLYDIPVRQWFTEHWLKRK